MNICPLCSRQFIRSEAELSLLSKIGVPESKLCPKCSYQRRVVRRNERNLYNRKCDLCQKEIVSVYPEGTRFPVYCHDCWWSDKWDAKSFGLTYDPNRSFFEQFYELQCRVPRLLLRVVESEGCEYCNIFSYSKNCYLSFAGTKCENVHYSRHYLKNNKDSLDLLVTCDSELCYKLIDARNCYGSKYLQECYDCRDCSFGYRLSSCQDCFMCVGLSHKKFCFKNEQLTEAEYKKQIAAYDTGSYKNLAKTEREFETLVERLGGRGEVSLRQSEEVTGDYLENSKHVDSCFTGIGIENSTYAVECVGVKDCSHMANSGTPAELCHEGVNVAFNNYRVLYSSEMFNGREVEYCEMSYGGLKQSFGCIGLNKGEYRILNKQYSKADYEKLVERIKHEMTERGEYGEFFPMAISPFPYNKSFAQEYLPLSKDAYEALLTKERASLYSGKGSEHNWSPEKPVTKVPDGISGSMIPDHIEQADSTITGKAIICEVSGRPFRLIPPEVELYKRLRVPIPRLHPDVRYEERLKKRRRYRFLD